MTTQFMARRNKLSRELRKRQTAERLPLHDESQQLPQSVSSPLPQRLAVQFHPKTALMSNY